ncbi:MAG: hypothetical protein RRY10_07675, partial [Christensenellaceae bacterium]
EAVNVQMAYDDDPENQQKLEAAEKQTAERKTAYDERAAEKDERLADGGQIYQSYLGDLQRLEGEWKTAQEEVNRYYTEKANLDAEVAALDERIQSYGEQPQDPQAYTTPPWMGTLEENFKQFGDEQKTLNTAKYEMDKENMEGYRAAANILFEGDEKKKGKNETEDAYIERINKAYSEQQEKLAKDFAYEQSKIITETKETYKETMTDSQKAALSEYQGLLTGSAAEIGDAIEWLKTFTLPINIQVDAKGNVSATSTLPTKPTKPKTGKNAEGTNYWRGGQTVVGERGAEVVDLPRGSKITPAHMTQQQPSGNDININITMPGMVVREQADINAIAAEFAHRLALAGINRG